MKTLTVTLDPCISAKDLAHACRIYHAEWYNRCPMGFFQCPLRTQKPCEDVTAKDWEAIMQDETVLEVTHAMWEDYIWPYREEDEDGE